MDNCSIGPRPCVMNFGGWMVVFHMGGNVYLGTYPLTSSTSLLIVIPPLARYAHSRMTISWLLLLMERPFHGTTEQVELRRNITPNLMGSRKVSICIHSISFGRMDSPTSVQDNFGVKSGKVLIRGNLGSKMGLIRKRAKISFCELEFKNQ